MHFDSLLRVSHSTFAKYFCCNFLGRVRVNESETECRGPVGQNCGPCVDKIAHNMSWPSGQGCLMNIFALRCFEYTLLKTHPYSWSTSHLTKNISEFEYYLVHDGEHSYDKQQYDFLERKFFVNFKPLLIKSDEALNVTFYPKVRVRKSWSVLKSNPSFQSCNGSKKPCYSASQQKSDASNNFS